MDFKSEQRVRRDFLTVKKHLEREHFLPSLNLNLESNLPYENCMQVFHVSFFKLRL